MLLRLSLILLTLGLVSSLRAQEADGIYTHVDEKPAPTHTVRPDYPYDMKRQGLEGIVAVTCVIDENGNVQNPEVKKSSNSGFDKAAVDALLKWKFKPAKVGGKQVKCRVTIPFRFNLDES